MQVVAFIIKSHLQLLLLLVLFTFQGVTRPVQASDRLDVLIRLAEEYESRFKQEKAEALKIADSTGIPVRQTLYDGRVIELMKFENGAPVYYTTHNREGSEVINSHKLYPEGVSGLNLTGRDQVLGIWDEGRVRGTHQEFTDGEEQRVIQIDDASELSDHATHVAGTMIASGVNEQARGMAFNANLYSYDWNNDISEMALAAAAGLKVSQHSYGIITGWSYGDRSGESGWHWYGSPDVSETEDYRFGFYNNTARAWDDIVFHAPNYLVVKSAGNDRGQGPDPGQEHFVWQDGGWKKSTTIREVDGGEDGYDCISGAAVAKNIVVVGAVHADGGMSGFSGWGPTDDGRIKPDIVAKGVSVVSAISKDDESYGLSSGTSMSGPMVSGSAGLLLEYQEQLYPAKSLMASTIKALIIHTANDMIGGAEGPDYRHGWGLMNTDSAAMVMKANKAAKGIHIMELQMANSGEIVIPVKAAGDKPLQATIAWSDVPGSPVEPSLNPPDLMLVNDLDMRITCNNGSVFKPFILDPYNPEKSAETGDNYRDNVEMVKITNPDQGDIYFITINHKGRLAGGIQQFSLIVTGNESITGVLNPAEIATRTLDTDHIEISWQKNSDNDNILLAWSANNTFGIPENGTPYSPGEILHGGGEVLYTGEEESFDHTGLPPVSEYYYRAFSVNKNYYYSNGITASGKTGCGEISLLPFLEDFDRTGELPFCWNITDNTETGQIWEIGVHSDGLRGSKGNYAYIMSSPTPTGAGQDSDLISPLFDFTDYTEVTISFNHYFKQFYSSAASLYYSVYNSDNWTKIDQWTEDTANPSFYSRVILDLAGKSGVRFKWNYKAFNDNHWSIDDITITGTIDSGLPQLTTNDVTGIDITTALSGGFVFDQGDSEITDRGVVWSSLKPPSLSDNDGFTVDGSGTGQYESALSGLTHDTEYFLRAYATNSQGTNYGNLITFKTTDAGKQLITFIITNRNDQPLADVKVGVTGDNDALKKIGAGSDSKSGKWIYWDSGVNHSSIGLDSEGPWTSAIRFESNDLDIYKKMSVEIIRLYINDIANSATVLLWQGESGINLDEKRRMPVDQKERSWVDVEISPSYIIEPGYELWIGVEWDDPGEGVFPAGTDLITNPQEKGNLIMIGTYPGSWNNLTDYDLGGDWNLHAYVSEVPQTRHTESNGTVSFELEPGHYKYSVEKRGYTNQTGAFNLEYSAKNITIVLEEEVLYSLELKVEPEDGGVAAGGGDYPESETVEISATANDGFEFEKWTGSAGYIEDEDSPVTRVNMPGYDISLTAIFKTAPLSAVWVDGEISVFPNPFSEYIEIENATEVSRIRVTDISGITLIDNTLHSSGRQIISTNHLPEGLYIITLWYNNGEVSVLMMLKSG